MTINVDVKIAKPSFWHYPKIFHVVLFIEFWERLAFYGLQSVAILYFIQKFNLSGMDANNLFASFAALIYAFAALGGAIGDKLLGLKRTYLLGMLFLVVGYVIFAVSIDVSQIYLAMGFILVGSVLFKAVSTTYVSRCFESNDPRLDSAYTYFYMIVNLGGLCGTLILPALVMQFGYSISLSVCFFVMIISIISLLIYREKFFLTDNQIGKNHQSKWLHIVGIIVSGIIFAYIFACILNNFALSKFVLYIVAFITFIVYAIVAMKENKTESKGMFIALVLILQAVIFFMLYIQLNTSIAVFATHNVRLNFGGYTVEPSMIRSFNLLFVALFAPFLAVWYIRLYKRKISINIPFKFALSLVLAGFSFITLAVGASFGADALGQVSLLWLILAHAFYALGEILLSALGPVMMVKLLPKRIAGFGIGVWFLSSAIGIRLGAEIANWDVLAPYSMSNVISELDKQIMLFLKLGGISVVIGLILLVISKSVTRAMNEVLRRRY